MVETDQIGGEQFRKNHSTVDRTSDSRYDVVLAAIPITFTLAILIGSLFSIPLNVALFGASLIGAVAIIDGIFLNPPV